LEKGELRSIGDGYKIVGEYQGVSHNAKVRVEGQIGERWGSGEAEITKVELLDQDLNPKEMFVTGRPLTIRINLDAHVPITDAVVGIRITHLHGTNVWGTNTKRRAFSIPRIHGTSSVDLLIDSLPLLEGTYDLTIALSDHAEVHPFDHWEKRIRFDVHQYDTFDEGLVQISSTWKFSN
jgi:hypothetical protein